MEWVYILLKYTEDRCFHVPVVNNCGPLMFRARFWKSRTRRTPNVSYRTPNVSYRPDLQLNLDDLYAPLMFRTRLVPCTLKSTPELACKKKSCALLRRVLE